MTSFQFDVTMQDIEAARRRLQCNIRRTPLYVSETLGHLIGCEVAVKLQSLQIGGSFKIRGVLNKLALLSLEEKERGIATVSGGNHAIAVAIGSRLLGIPAVVMMAKSTPAMNIDATRAHGAEVVLADDIGEAFRLAEAEREKGRTFVHPYDDPSIIAGHGTLGLEIADEYHPTHTLIGIGGGGFAAGVSTAIKARFPDSKVFGVETVGATTMSEALKQNKPVAITPVSIVKTLGAPFVTDQTLAAAKKFLEGVIVVEDSAAVDGVFKMLAAERVLCEPAAGCVLSAAMTMKSEFSNNSRLCLVICGSNVDFISLVKANPKTFDF
jgi:threonine dehydratase